MSVRPPNVPPEDIVKRVNAYWLKLGRKANARAVMIDKRWGGRQRHGQRRRAEAAAACASEEVMDE